MIRPNRQGKNAILVDSCPMVRVWQLLRWEVLAKDAPNLIAIHLDQVSPRNGRSKLKTMASKSAV
jgi:hypothetical protein